jgi:hypothetical protein
VLQLNKATRHEEDWGSGGIAPCIVNLALKESEWSVSSPGFTSEERTPDTEKRR